MRQSLPEISCWSSGAAERLGYSDYTNFIRAFRQVTGKTPHDFRLNGWITLPKPFQRQLSTH